MSGIVSVAKRQQLALILILFGNFAVEHVRLDRAHDRP
jgi:hypothetical protein